jgi:hypothetical protein
MKTEIIGVIGETDKTITIVGIFCFWLGLGFDLTASFLLSN